MSVSYRVRPKLCALLDASPLIKRLMGGVGRRGCGPCHINLVLEISDFQTLQSIGFMPRLSRGLTQSDGVPYAIS